MSELLTSKTVKTRKRHWCLGCNRNYPAGTAMLYQTGVDSGDFWSCYFCPTCAILLPAFWKEHRYYLETDGMRDGDILNDDEYIDKWLAERLKGGGA